LKQLGRFNPLFFIYGEVVNFYLCAKKLGYTPMFNPVAEIIHYGGASEKSKLNRWEKILRAKATIIRLNWSQKSVGFGIGMLLLWTVSRVVIMKIFSVLAPKKFTTQSGKWTQIWLKRKGWQKGFCKAY